MSQKYPSADGGRNAEANRMRQRNCHTAAYHQKHVEREMREHAQAKVEAFRQSNPERYERIQQRRSQEPDSPLSAKDSNCRENYGAGAGRTAAGIGSLGLGAEVLVGITAGQAVVALAAVGAIAAAAYGGYRIYKWYRAKR